MNIIIDTHIFLWLLGDVDKISSKHFKYIESNDNNIYLSSISIAEIMIKNSIGNLDVEYNLVDILDEMGIKVLDFNGQSALLLGSLPFHYKDPFDRMIISQAINEKYKIISVDKKFTFYDCDLL